MPDTRREQSALQTAFADNTTGAITAQNARDLIVTAHPSELNQSGSYASFPSAPVTGDIFRSELHVWRYSGSSWIPFGPVYSMTDPTIPTWAWINQGSATVDTTKGGIYLAGPGSGGSDSFKVRKKAAPTTPYTISVAFLAALYPGTNTSCGLCFREAATGKLVAYTVNQGSGLYSNIQINAYTNPTTYSTTYLDSQNRLMPQQPCWLRMADDGTNRRYSFAMDGQNWIELLNHARTTFFTADEVGFFLSDQDGPSGMTLLSWKEA